MLQQYNNDLLHNDHTYVVPYLFLLLKQWPADWNNAEYLAE
jgi:hypothetical protein